MNLTTHYSPVPATSSGSPELATSCHSPRDLTNLDHLSGADRDRLRARLERKQKAGSPRPPSADDRFQWAGKKVRSKKTGATYTIRQVFKNNRVELEKSWMTYSSDVSAIRSDYEICV